MNQPVEATTGDEAFTKLASAAGALAGTRYIQAAINWTGTILIIRHLSEADWGRLAFIFALLGLIGLVSDLKVGRIVLRNVLDESPGARESAGSYLAFRAVIGLASYAVAMAVVVGGPYPTDVVQGTAIAGLVLLLSSCSTALDLTFHARMRMGVIAFVTTASQLLQLAAILALLASGRTTVVWLTVPAVAAALLNLFLKLFYGRSFYQLQWIPARWWTWIKEAAPLSVGGLLTAMYLRIDTLMLSRLDTFEAVGRYGIGYKFADVVESFPAAVMVPTFVLLVRAWPDDRARFSHVFRQSFGILVVVGAATLVGFLAFAEPLTVLLYGERYGPAAPAARWLMVGQVLNFFSLLCFTILTAVGRHRLYPIAGVVGLVVNIGLNAVLIPAYSYEGAAQSTVITEVIVLAILVTGTVRVPGVRPVPLAVLARTTLAALAMAGAIIASSRAVAWPVSAAIGFVVYLCAAQLLRVGGPGGLRGLVRPITASDHVDPAPAGGNRDEPMR